MAFTIEATYENGILKLDRPLPLEDNRRVRVTVSVGASRAEETYGLLRWAGDPKILEEIALSPEYGIEEAP